jgi:hypothetical protein
MTSCFYDIIVLAWSNDDAIYEMTMKMTMMIDLTGDYKLDDHDDNDGETNYFPI